MSLGRRDASNYALHQPFFWKSHTRTVTTAHYAHLANDPLKAAANRIASRIA